MRKPSPIVVLWFLLILACAGIFVARPFAADEAKEPVKQWEYKIVGRRFDEELFTRYGRDGWEFVGTFNDDVNGVEDRAVFKRPKQ
jgi:hypothetical protein